ncbi:M28 family peptidase [Lysobacter sp. BMK333-48F3]|uniref:M28 family peptidase n=1 Tax=Lysobacter sp. BMK333-48F3 TaxID=2867962 RepID=UPI001C8BF70F|nr:M28 family peptidase [Lysobacter sp. BMK333-48F3]MBX9399678.1 M28 family peptidase [Lysobacter sp. BMK333-48F3]
MDENQAVAGGDGKPQAQPKGLWRTVVGLAAIAAVIAAVWSLSSPPPLRSGEGDARAFSVERAMAHVRQVAQTPHPTGSQANARVRDYLLAQLRASGLQVQVQRELSPGQGGYAWVENIVGVLPAQDAAQVGKPGNGLLLMSHYDSIPWAPGAADAGAGVATVLEAARVAAASQPGARKRDLIVLLSDGEEMGMYGARAFFDRHPLATRVGTVLNFEARGSSGPVLMFQSGPGSAPLLRALHGAAPVAGSYTEEIYKRMPNHTDFSVALERGLPGLNFAFIGGYSDYHSPTDTPANLAPATLQHMGDQALASMRAALSAASLAPAAGAEPAYTNFTGKLFLQYPRWLDPAALVLATLLFGFAAWRGRSEAVGVLAAARAALAVLAAVATAASVVLAVSAGLRQDFWPGAMQRAVAALQGEWFLAWAVLAVGVLVAMLGAARGGLRWWWALALALLAGLPMLRAGSVFVPGLIAAALAGALLFKPLSEAALARGGEVLLLALAWLLVLALPGAANILVWPLLAVAIGRVFAVLRASPGSAGSSWPPMVPALLVGGVVLGQLALGLDQALGVGVPVIGVVPVLLLCVLCLPAWIGAGAARAGAALTLAGLAATVALVFVHPFDGRHPQPSSVFALDDRVQGLRCLATIDANDDAWKRGLLGDAARALPQNLYAPEVWRETRCRPLGDRAAATAAPARIRVLGVERAGELRRMRLALSLDQGHDVLDLYLPKGADVRSASVQGRSIQAPAAEGFEQWPARIRGFAVPAGELEIALDLGPGPLPQALLAVTIDHRLPAGLALPPRPAGLMRQTHPYSDASVAVARIGLTAAAGRATP